MKIGIPQPGSYYHGVYPGGTSGWEDEPTVADLKEYEKAVNRRAAWVYFSHNWFREDEENGHGFPTKTIEWIRDEDCVPFVRLMLRSKLDEVTGPDPTYSLAAINAGVFDDRLREWAKAARSNYPLLVEWGTEMNGGWFHWNGGHNGGVGIGPARFRAAYRRIVEIIRSSGADNITWVFHPNATDWPTGDWNAFENYYPGDDVVDWLGLSHYGPQSCKEDHWSTWADGLDQAVPRLAALAPDKPIMLLEFGADGGSPESAKITSAWADNVLGRLLSNQWPEIRGFAWWNERWEEDEDCPPTDMRVQQVEGLADVFRRHLQHAPNVEDRPLLA